MKRIFEKIPITIWPLICIVGVGISVKNDYTTFIEPDLGVITSVLTVVGLYFLAIQVRNQTRSERVSTEYLNQPNFEFFGFDKKIFKDSIPNLCSEPHTLNYNQCSDLHWFDLIQTGKLPAKDVKITLIHKTEGNDISQLIDKRTSDEPMIYNGDKRQFKLPQHAVPLSLYDGKKMMAFLF